MDFDSSVLMCMGMFPLEWKQKSLCIIFPRFVWVGFSSLGHLIVHNTKVSKIDAKRKHRWSMEINSFCLFETLHHFPSQNATTQTDRLPLASVWIQSLFQSQISAGSQARKTIFRKFVALGMNETARLHFASVQKLYAHFTVPNATSYVSTGFYHFLHWNTSNSAFLNWT